MIYTVQKKKVSCDNTFWGWGAGEMSQWLKTFAVLSEDWSPVPCITNNSQLIQHSLLVSVVTSYGIHIHTYKHTHMHACAYTHINKKTFKGYI